MNIAHVALLLNLVATLFMTGVIWIVQIVHYPLFDRVGTEGFLDYQKSHEHLITFVVAPPMLVELATATMLLFYRPTAVSANLAWVGLALVMIIWLSTVFFQIPCHSKLEKAFDADAHTFLVQSNWIRTVAWTLRSVLVVQMLIHCVRLD